VRQRSSRLTGALQFSFVHDLLQDMIYKQMPRPVRKIYHTRLANWLGARMKAHLFFDRDLIAHHYRKAGKSQATIDKQLLANEAGKGVSGRE
jgi:predicted ATPase